MLITFDGAGEKLFEAGVDHCVLYPQSNGAYPAGVAWNGITNITESPEGGDAQDFYADNIKYGSLRGAENFNGTIECFTYPDEWKGCDGRRELVPGVSFGQQSRKAFGLSYRTLIGSDSMELGDDFILHLIYGATASPSSKTRSTVNESPEASPMSYEFKTTPVNVTKVENAKATSHLEIQKSLVGEENMAMILAALYGTDPVYAEAEPEVSDNPKTKGWYEKVNGAYVATEDTSVNESKTYYVRTSAGTDGHLLLPDELFDLIQ